MVLARLGLLLALVVGGHLARRIGILNERRTEGLTAFAFYVALPALIFLSTYDQRPAEIASVELVAGMGVTYAVILVLAWVVHSRDGQSSRRSVGVVQSYHANMGYIGLPLVTTGLGSAAAGRASVILGVGSLVQITLTVLVLVRVNGTEVSVPHQFKGLATNPILIALVIGLVVATQRLGPPAPLLQGLEYVSLTALPVALLGVGASLQRSEGSNGLERVGGVLAVKLVAMPAVAYVALTALGADPLTVAAGVVMLGAPSAVSTYIYATELGGDDKLASTNVFVTTLVGLVTMSVLLVLLG